jgi:hypothetical protein
MDKRTDCEASGVPISNRENLNKLIEEFAIIESNERAKQVVCEFLPRFISSCRCVVHLSDTATDSVQPTVTL